MEMSRRQLLRLFSSELRMHDRRQDRAPDERRLKLILKDLKALRISPTPLKVLINPTLFRQEERLELRLNLIRLRMMRYQCLLERLLRKSRQSLNIRETSR